MNGRARNYGKSILIIFLLLLSLSSCNLFLSILGEFDAFKLVITPDELDMGVGESEQLSVIALYQTYSYKDVSTIVKWSSSNTDIVRISETGNAKGFSGGETKITADYGDQKVTITVIIGSSLKIPPPGAVVFTKANYADPSLEENQDIITDIVRITRADSKGLYNAYSQESYSSDGPYDTEWALGATNTHILSDYDIWIDAVAHDPSGYLNEILSLHLITDDLFFDVEFTSFTGGGIGGGFSYHRVHVDPP